MGLLSWLGFRPAMANESRAITSVPWQDSLPFNRMPGISAPVPEDLALTLSAVYAAVRLISSSISTLPLKAYRKGGEQRIPMSNMPQLFDILTTDGQLVPWLHRCATSLCLRGNAYGLIISRDGFGYPTVIDWLAPQRVACDDRPGMTGWLVDGREVPRADILHIPLFPVPGQRVGLSPIASFARTVGVGLQAQTYAADWFQAGGFPPGTFRNTAKTITQEEASIIKARATAAIRSREILTFGADWEYTAISVPPEEAQFVETMKMTTNQVAAVYGIPPEMIGGESGSSMTYANVEQQQINFVMFTLRPWLVTLESAFSAVLPDRQYVKFNSDALIRADLKTRWEVNQLRVNMGAASINEIRLQEDMPSIPGGDEYGPKPLPAAPNQPNQDGAPAAPLRRIQ